MNFIDNYKQFIRPNNFNKKYDNESDNSSEITLVLYDNKENNNSKDIKPNKLQELDNLVNEHLFIQPKNILSDISSINSDDFKFNNNDIEINIEDDNDSVYNDSVYNDSLYKDNYLINKINNKHYPNNLILLGGQNKRLKVPKEFHNLKGGFVREGSPQNYFNCDNNKSIQTFSNSDLITDSSVLTFQPSDF